MADQRTMAELLRAPTEGWKFVRKKLSRCVDDYRNKYKVRNSRSKRIVSQVKACDVNYNSKIAKLTHEVNQQTSDVTTAMTAMLKQFQATPPPAPVKVVEETCVTAVVLIRITSVLPPVATLSQNSEIISKDTFHESEAGIVYDDPFDSKREKIKESKLLIDELDLPCDFLPPSEYDSFISQDFSRVDALPSTNNEDMIFNPCILI
nr:hypothetical protein [Tanacetum cinerariifolium]